MVVVALMVTGGLFALNKSAKTADPQLAIEKYGSNILKVFNWGEYIDPEVNRAFERQYGVKVIYDTFDSNELMYNNLQVG